MKYKYKTIMQRVVERGHRTGQGWQYTKEEEKDKDIDLISKAEDGKFATRTRPMRG